MDVSRLKEMGWKPPERFVVKAADGVTDIYGNMWKPFDFDSHEEVSDHRARLSGPADGAVTYTLHRRRRAAAARAARLHRHPDRQPRRQPAALERVPELRLLQPARLRAGRQEGGHRAARGAAHVHRHRPRRHLRPLGRRLPHRRGADAAAVQRLLQGRRVVSRATTTTTSTTRTGASSTTACACHGTATPRSAVASARSAVAARRRRQRAHAADGGATADTSCRTDMRFAIRVPDEHRARAEPQGQAAARHGDMDNNVHPGDTIRLVDALIKANKRFDFMMLPGQAARVRPHAAVLQPHADGVFRGAPDGRLLPAHRRDPLNANAAGHLIW